MVETLGDKMPTQSHVLPMEMSSWSGAHQQIPSPTKNDEQLTMPNMQKRRRIHYPYDMRLCPCSPIWVGCSLGLNTSHVPKIDFQSLWRFLVSQVKGQAGETEVWTWFALGSWFLWKRRNKWVFQGTLPSIEDTIDLTQQRIDEWRTSHENRHLPEPKPNPLTLQRFFTANILCVDASRNPDNGQTGLGWVYRKSDELIYLAGSAFLTFTVDADYAELQAIHSAILSIQRITTNVMIMTDSMNAQQVLNENGDLSDHALLAREIRMEAPTLGNHEFHHIPRMCYTVAHELARKALFSCSSTVWDDSMPILIGSVVRTLFG
ncbi:hypothetical protein Scep_007561 [Stephania cephalantha]|uniref:RNase H type-1 domain-containing protein n=1 Tax=Stephania cephalantha TaxID=152367 RepID=A0AAP0KC35_9MAGN